MLFICWLLFGVCRLFFLWIAFCVVSLGLCFKGCVFRAVCYVFLCSLDVVVCLVFVVCCVITLFVVAWLLCVVGCLLYLVCCWL